jgi:glycerate kinase
MTGCAGGLSGGLYAFRGATLVPGAAYVLDAIGFDGRLRDAAFVVTGEGALDAQTLAGKAVGELAVRCRDAAVPCHAVVGRSDLDDATAELGLASVREAGTIDALRAAGRELAR